MPLSSSPGVPVDSINQVGQFSVMRDNGGAGLAAGGIYNGAASLLTISTWTAAGATTGGSAPAGNWRALTTCAAGGTCFMQRVS